MTVLIANLRGSFNDILKSKKQNIEIHRLTEAPGMTVMRRMTKKPKMKQRWRCFQ